MIGISLCVFFSIFHVVLSLQVPQHCTELPREVENPRDCCKSESIFSEEDLIVCTIASREDEKRGVNTACSIATCLMYRYSLMKDENTVDKEAVAAFLDKYVDNNADYKDVVESVKELCLKDDLPGPSEVCEAKKVSYCTATTMFMRCPTWENTDNCNKLKIHFEDCKQYYM